MGGKQGLYFVLGCEPVSTLASNQSEDTRDMTMAFEELEKQARSLSREEKATLARILIEELDTASDPNAEQLWLEEAQSRYDAFLRGEIEARDGDEVMQRARKRLGSRDI